MNEREMIQAIRFKVVSDLSAVFEAKAKIYGQESQNVIDNINLVKTLVDIELGLKECGRGQD